MELLLKLIFKALRMLLLRVPGPTGWDDLRGAPPNNTFVQGAIDRQMIEDPQMWVDTIIEAFDGMRGLRRCINWISTLFASTQMMNIKEVFQKVLDHQKAYLTPGHMLHSSKEDIKNYVLTRMEWVFRIQGVPHEDGMTCCEWLGLDPPANFHVQDEIEAIFCLL